MGTQPARLHCYGKLPLVEEFIHYQAEDESLVVEAWLDAGHRLVAGVRGVGPKSPPEASSSRRYAFVFDSGKSTKIVVGILHESRDRTGTRRFPFSFFATTDAAGFRGRPSLMPILLRSAWEGMDREMAPFGDLRDSQALTRILNGLTMSVPAPTEEAAKDLAERFSATRCGELWTVLLPGASKSRRVQMFELIVRAIQPVGKSRGQGLPVILKVPVCGSFEETSFQSAFWIELLQRMTGGTRTAPNAFLSLPGSGQAPTSVQLFFQPPDDKHFACLMSPHYESEYVDDVTVELTIPLSGTVISDSGRRLLESDDPTLADLIGFGWC